MEFIYRMPLLDFDVFDDAEVNANYSKVLAGIAVASPSFYQCIKDRSYMDLIEKERISVFKYMLRGRFRAVPFGLWAGQGLGQTGSTQAFTPQKPVFYAYNVSTVSPEHQGDDVEYQVVPGLYRCDGMYHFWGFDNVRKRWVEQVVPSNLLTEILFPYCKDGKTINYIAFGQLFDKVPEKVVRGLWLDFINSGLLQPLGIGNFLNSKPILFFSMSDVLKANKPQISVDAYFENDITIDERQVASLSFITMEMGNIFARRNAVSIQHFKDAFLKDHDDRFVVFDRLNRPYSEVSKVLKNGLGHAYRDRKWIGATALMTYILGKQADQDVDLSNFVKHKPIPPTPEVAVFFKEGPSPGMLSIDQITCGRSLAFCGRSTLNPKLHEFAERLTMEHYSAPDVHFAGVELFESPQVNRLAINQSVFPLSIVPFRHPVSANEIGSADIWVGILNNEIVLIYGKTGKRLVPVFPHALNPAFISHPLVLLLWIVANQYSFSLRDEILGDFPGVRHMPRIRWRNLILRPEAWYIRGSRDMGIDGLRSYLKKNKVPRYVLTGEDDQELFLDLEHALCLLVLLGNVRRHDRVILRENPWFDGNSDLTKENRLVQYPQFLVSLGTGFRWRGLGHELINIKEAENTDWLSYHIYIKQSECIWFLTTYLWPIMDGLEQRNLLVGWYYLVYTDTGFHIRLRVKSARPSIVHNEIAGILLDIDAVEGLKRMSYYPEFSKYGCSGIEQSEHIFHFESQLAIGGKVKRFCLSKPLILAEEYEVFQLVIDMFFKLLFHFGLLAVCMEYFDHFVFHELSKTEKKRMIGNFKKLQKCRATLESWGVKGSALAEAYLKLYENHERFTAREQSVLFIKNHLHMFINRLFPDISLEAERLVWFAIGRKFRRNKFAD